MSTSEFQLPAEHIEDHQDEFEDESVEIAQEILEKWSAGSIAPSTAAAAAMYAAGFITDEGITQERCSDVFGTSEVSIRKVYSEAFSAYRD